MVRRGEFATDRVSLSFFIAPSFLGPFSLIPDTPPRFSWPGSDAIPVIARLTRRIPWLDRSLLLWNDSKG